MNRKSAAQSHIESTIASLREHSSSVIKNVLLMSNIPTFDVQQAMHSLHQHGRVALHFHPDRLDSRGISVVAGLLKDGVYKSQFETHISNGQLSPELGGPRDHWENQLFGQCYSGVKQRPKYGALDIGLCPMGPAPRFGSCYFLTHAQLLSRCTFSYMDSYRLPKEKGTLANFEVVLAALLSECFERQYALGVNNIKPADIVDHVKQQLPLGIQRRFLRPTSANLDHYIEAQIHGEVSLDDDIAYLVADPSFKATDTGDVMQLLCDEYDIELLWHPGYQLEVGQVPIDFRGATMPELAKVIARDNKINAEVIGRAAQVLTETPVAWSERSKQAQQLQQLKLMWHVLVKFGAQLPQT
ncbi:DUF3626 domain-containing protein [Shewanella sp. MMG014]|uniref:DUF3626 domain-containing protein n=1 Tax=Shewanella sp. MMG014 TaxID=2822691 RepID=UPI001B39075D|nr:DUF3626 domain-containing protein [Shewanella sp. MMG014]MBQ4889594.1 DUF3626 domain-containing protein [Shewanella sp. MMG014]